MIYILWRINCTTLFVCKWQVPPQQKTITNKNGLLWKSGVNIYFHYQIKVQLIHNFICAALFFLCLSEIIIVQDRSNASSMIEIPGIFFHYVTYMRKAYNCQKKPCQLFSLYYGGGNTLPPLHRGAVLQLCLSLQASPLVNLFKMKYPSAIIIWGLSYIKIRLDLAEKARFF